MSGKHCENIQESVKNMPRSRQLLRLQTHRHSSFACSSLMSCLTFLALSVFSMSLFRITSGQGGAAAITQCHLRRNFTAAEVQPWNANLTYGCKRPIANKSHHFFSSYKSASQDSAIDVLLLRGDRHVGSAFKLSLFSYGPVNWRLTADRNITVKSLKVFTFLRDQFSSVDVDSDMVTVICMVRRNEVFRGVLATGEYVEFGVPQEDDSLSLIRSFTAVYSASNVTLSVGTEVTLSVGTEGYYDNGAENTFTPVTTVIKITATSNATAVGSNSGYSTNMSAPVSPVTQDSAAEDSLVSVALSTTLSVIGAIIVLLVVGFAVLRMKRRQKPCISEKQISFKIQRDLVTQVKELLPDVVIVCKSRLTIGSLLGQGHFGLVHEGFYALNSNSTCDRRLFSCELDVVRNAGQTLHIKVAVKSMRHKNKLGSDSFTEFLSECASMQNLSHPNVLHLVGVCIGHEDIDEPLILSPFMANGDLKSYLSNKLIECDETEDPRKKMPVGMEELMSYALQICLGMEYLASCSIIHRDLAARNCMLDDQKKVKIADFGMARLMDEEDCYKQVCDKPVPVKWMAPESILQRVYSEKSDVWSFGVTAWEIFSLGKPPYIDVANAHTVEYLCSGGRLDRPNTCPQDLFEIIESCWMWSPSSRDDFKTLVNKLNEVCHPRAGIDLSNN